MEGHESKLKDLQWTRFEWLEQQNVTGVFEI